LLVSLIFLRFCHGSLPELRLFYVAPDGRRSEKGSKNVAGTLPKAGASSTELPF